MRFDTNGKRISVCHKRGANQTQQCHAVDTRHLGVLNVIQRAHEKLTIKL